MLISVCLCDQLVTLQVTARRRRRAESWLTSRQAPVGRPRPRPQQRLLLPLSPFLPPSHGTYYSPSQEKLSGGRVQQNRVIVEFLSRSSVHMLVRTAITPGLESDFMSFVIPIHSIATGDNNSMTH